MGRYDIASQAAIDRLCAYQKPCGGFVGRTNPDTPKINLCLTAQLADACLALGRWEAARRAADFIVRMLEQQPDMSKYLYFQADARTGKLIERFPKGESVYYRIDTEGGKQHFYYAGITAGYLSQMYTPTEYKGYLDAAREWLEFDYRTPEEGFKWPSKCKVGWGAALLYRVTGEAKYRELAEKVADITYVATQKEAGNWEPVLIPMYDDSSGFELSAHELTAEFCYELVEIVRGLCGRSPEPILGALPGS